MRSPGTPRSLLLGATLLLACGPSIVLDDGGAGTTSGSGSGSGSADGGVGRTSAEPTGRPPGSDGMLDDGTATDALDPAPDPTMPTAFYIRGPDELSLFVTTFAGAACPDPTPDLACRPFPQWSLEIRLRPMLEPGEYSLSEVQVYFSETTAGPPGGCAAGFGDFSGTGTLVIDSVSDTIAGYVVDADLQTLDPSPSAFAFVATPCAR